jgi:predicted CxxxxCH...CXXCH cytochrome family protein
MSQIGRFMMIILLLLAGSLFVAGCGSEKNENALIPEGESHPADWKWTHQTAAQQDPNACAECHGADFSGGISKVSCASCHLNGSPLTVTECLSCHGNPPTGTVGPNRAGAHNTTTGHFTAHVTLPDGCNTCHNGAGTGTSNHDNGVVDVRFLSSYSAKSGAAAYNADGTCSKTSCHGGQTTPGWLTGTIDVGTQCTMCHSSGTSEYNSFSSGWHDLHLSIPGITCTPACHDVTKLAQNHFTSLNTTAMEGPASATVGGLVSSYTGTLGTCTVNCHVQRQWFNPNPQP